MRKSRTSSTVLGLLISILTFSKVNAKNKKDYKDSNELLSKQDKVIFQVPLACPYIVRKSVSRSYKLVKVKLHTVNFGTIFLGNTY